MSERKVRILEYTVIRNVTPEECPWLDATVPRGSVVYQCWKHDFGCVTPSGTACTHDPQGDYPFFELPTNALVAG